MLLIYPTTQIYRISRILDITTVAALASVDDERTHNSDTYGNQTVYNLARVYVSFHTGQGFLEPSLKQ